MTIKDNVAPLARDTQARIRPVNLLGEKYIELQQGDSPTSLPDGGKIPVGQTGRATELDDIFNSVDLSVRARLRQVINEFGIASTGHGAAFAKTLESMPRSLDEANELLSSVAASTNALETAIRSGDRVLSRVAAKRDDFGDLIASANSALRTVAERRERLGATLASAPAFLRNGQTTLGELDRAATNLRPTARRLTATATPLAQTLEALPPFRESAQGTLRTAKQVAPALARLGDKGAPPVRRLRPTAQNLSQFAHDMGPLMANLGPEGGGLKSILRFFVSWAGVTKNRDGLGQIFKVRFDFDEELVQTAIDQFLHEANGKKKAKSAPKAPTPVAAPKAAPAPSAGQPESKKDPVKNLTKSLGDTLRKPLDKLNQDLGKTLDNVGGLARDPLGTLKGDQQQQRGGQNGSRLLDYLLGP
jgi:phospholipid/cholesterol/gamma-HCH transport system substrate-binding protein